MTDIGMILGRLGHKLVMQVAPKLEGDYAAGHAAMAGLMAVMAGEMWDGAADRLVNEIAGLRSLLALGGVDPGVKAAVSLKVSDLTFERDALASELIALQHAIETRPDEAALTLNARIWGHLMQTAAARMPSPPVFANEDQA